MRAILTAVAVAVAFVAVGKVEACERCRPVRERTTYQGKLVKVEEQAPVQQANVLIQPKKPQTIITWTLETKDKTFHLNLGSRTLIRLAQKLEGSNVVVTGTFDGSQIDVWEMEAK